MQQRVVRPEMLDSLPEEDPDAQASRRDLRRINGWQRSFAWIGRCLKARRRAGESVLELASGDGALGLSLARGGVLNPGRPQLTGLDFWRRPHDWPTPWGWVQGDLLDYPGYPQFGCVVANLICHQLADSALARLGECLRSGGTRLIVVNEPLRSARALWGLRALGLTGLNRVTRHDGRVSIAAGFRDQELPELLGLEAPAWTVDVHQTALGAYRMVAERQPVKGASAG